MSKPVRITLTKSQINTEFGTKLVALLKAIAEDSNISLEEVAKLQEVLKSGPATIPAVNFLLAETSASLLDSIIDDCEKFRLKCAIERVLPKGEREGVAQALAGIISPGFRSIWSPSPPELATVAQLNYIRALGADAPHGLTKEDASEMITALRLKASVSNRQIMVLRFWDRMDLQVEGRHAVSAWMDEFYSDDPARKDTWEEFKRAYGDDGSQRDPSWVPMGAGWKLCVPAPEVEAVRISPTVSSQPPPTPPPSERKRPAPTVAREYSAPPRNQQNEWIAILWQWGPMVAFVFLLVMAAVGIANLL